MPKILNDRLHWNNTMTLFLEGRFITRAGRAGIGGLLWTARRFGGGSGHTHLFSRGKFVFSQKSIVCDASLAAVQSAAASTSY